MVNHFETPNSSPTPATPINSVNKAPMADIPKVPADNQAHPLPKCCRINSPWPFRVTMPKRTVISCAAYRIGISNNCGKTIAYPHCAPDCAAVIKQPASVSANITIKPGPYTFKKRPIFNLAFC